MFCNKLQKEKDTVMVRILLCLVIVFAIGNVWVAHSAETSPAFTDSIAVNEHIEYSPINHTYELWGWSILRYHYYRFLNLFAGYPWAVRVAYGVILGCITGFLFVLIAMIIDVYRTQRTKRFYEQIRERYFEKMKSVCSAEVKNLPIEEISRRLDYRKKNWRAWQMRIWARLLVDLCQFTNTSNPNLTNIQRIMHLIGFTDFVEQNLIFGAQRRKVRLLQAVRLTNMQLPNSLVTRLVNDKDPALRKSARIYYMLTSKEDPFVFFEEKRLAIDMVEGSYFSLWDKIETHEIFGKIYKSGRALPKFVPILQSSENRDMTIFLMRETAYWGNEKELKYIISYFDSFDFEFRRTAFECMGIRRYVPVEETLKNLFYKQTEMLRRTILNALLAMNSGRSIQFYAEVYQTPSSDYTRRTALRCLWLSGKEGRSIFDTLKESAVAKDHILFEHVENPIINGDGLWET